MIARFFDLVHSDITRSLTSFIFHADFKHLIEKIKWVIKNEKAFEAEIKDEQGQWNLLRILPYLTEEKIIDGAIVTLIDINEIKLSQAKLKETDAKLNQALQKNHLAVFRWDFEKNIIEHDNNLSIMFGMTENQSLQDYEKFEACVVPEDREGLKNVLSKALTTDELHFSLQYRIIWPDKSVHFIAVRGQVHQTDTGKKHYMSGVCWDITEYTRAEEILARRMDAE